MCEYICVRPVDVGCKGRSGVKGTCALIDSNSWSNAGLKFTLGRERIAPLSADGSSASHTIFDGCSACRGRGSTLQASAQLHPPFLPPSTPLSRLRLLPSPPFPPSHP